MDRKKTATVPENNLGPNPTLVLAQRSGTLKKIDETEKTLNSKNLPAHKTLFTKEMSARAVAAGADPQEFLKAIAVDPDLVFSDFKLEFNKETKRSELVKFERPATINERIDCAKAILPYYVSKKPVELAHSGAVQMIHTLANTALDETEMDDQGRIIDSTAEEVGDDDLDM